MPPHDRYVRSCGAKNDENAATRTQAFYVLGAHGYEHGATGEMQEWIVASRMNQTRLPFALIDVSDAVRTKAAPASSGDVAFEGVYEQRWHPMVRLAALTTGSIAIAEEITQDAFVQLHRHWTTIDNPTGWLRAAVVNGCRDWVRRRIREPHPPVIDWFVTDDTEALAIRDALRVLTPRQRAAVVLRYFEDLPEREIAQLLDCRPGTIKSTLAHSLKKLAKELDR